MITSKIILAWAQKGILSFYQRPYIPKHYVMLKSLPISVMVFAVNISEGNCGKKSIYELLIMWVSCDLDFFFLKLSLNKGTWGKTGKTSLHYLSSFHDLLCFCVEVEISPQGFEQHLCSDPHPLTIDGGKLLDTETQSHILILMF